MDGTNMTNILQFETEKAINQRLPVVVFIASVMIVGVIGNVHVLFIFWKLDKKPSIYSIFVKALAFVDLATCVVHIPMEITDLMLPYTYIIVNGCKIFRYNQSFLLLVSVILLALISYERYNRVCRIHKQQLNPTRAKRIIFLVVAMSIIFAFPVYFVNGHHIILLPGNVTGVMCFIADEYVGSTFLYFTYAILLLCFAVSASFIIVSYIFILKFLLKKRKVVMKYSGNNIDRRRNSSQAIEFNEPIEFFCTEVVTKPGLIGHERLRTVKTTKTLIIITGLFIIVFLPFVVLSACISSNPSFKDNMNAIEMTIYQIAIRLILINNVANPFVYAFTDERFKQKLKLCYHLNTTSE
ncbi:unnamed protein product [Mytilus coruscus]|uniref:G-protein coupled receptors family 1 profile domain-containing protein n=1 Tax=Mytilus coruscus TaxID=42192 RepID=A0A6J8B8N1_MYTCO|nr:unnamed protein product [Mytilus coruscus]